MKSEGEEGTSDKGKRNGFIFIVNLPGPIPVNSAAFRFLSMRLSSFIASCLDMQRAPRKSNLPNDYPTLVDAK